MMKANLIILLFILPGFVLFPQNLDKDTVELQEVVVTAINPHEKDRSLTPMQSISGMELEIIPGNSVAEVVNTFSGVTLKDYGGIGGLKTVMVRSLGANHTGVFVDGIQFNDAATGQVDLGKISIQNASEVTLHVGHTNDLSQPARFYASASVININSTTPDFKSKSLHLKTSVKTGSFGLIQPSVSFQKKINDKSYTGLSVSYANAKGEYPFLMKYGSSSDTIAYRKNSDIKTLNINALFSYNFSEKQNLSLTLYYYRSERGLPGAIVYYNPFAAQRLWNNDFFSGIQYKNNVNKRILWLSTLKLSQSYLRYLDPEYLNTDGKIDNRYLQREYYVSQVLRYKIIDSLNFSFATDLFVNTLTTNLYNYSTPARYSSLSVFALQYTFNRLEMHGNILATYIAEKTVSGTPAPGRKKLSPTFSLGYKVLNSGNIRLRFLYKDIFRMPTFNDLYYTLAGNNNLHPENAKQFNLGISAYTGFMFIEYFSIKSDLFYNSVNDKIVAVPTKNLFVWSMQNIGVVDVRGLELQMQLQTKPFLKDFRFSIYSNYTYQKAMDITEKDSPTYRNQIPYIPFETFSSRSSLTYKNLSLSYNLLFNGFRYALGENIYYNMIPSWWVSDVSIFYSKEFNKYTLQMKGEISNIFNTQYEVIRSFPMPGRGYYLTLTLVY